MKKSIFLKKGDAISLVAPSFGCTTEPYCAELNSAIKNLKREGFKIKEGKNVRRNAGCCASAGPKARAEEFLDAYLSDSKLVLSVGGGETMCEMLPYVNFQKIKEAEPKLFMGFSDNTNLCFTLSTICDIPTVYGPCAPSFSRIEENHIQDALALLRGEKTKFEGYPKFGGEYVLNEKTGIRKFTYDKKKKITSINYSSPFEGTLIGGCLDILLVLVGTKFDRVKEFQSRHPEGLIWYLEACDLNPMEIRRGLFTLSQAGWFDNAKGFIIGRPLCIDSEYMGLKPHQAVTDMLKTKKVPILLDVDLGHLPPTIPVMNLAKAKVALKRNNIEIEMKL